MCIHPGAPKNDWDVFITFQGYIWHLQVKRFAMHTTTVQWLQPVTQLADHLLDSRLCRHCRRCTHRTITGAQSGRRHVFTNFLGAKISVKQLHCILLVTAQLLYNVSPPDFWSVSIKWIGLILPVLRHSDWNHVEHACPKWYIIIESKTWPKQEILCVITCCKTQQKPITFKNPADIGEQKRIIFATGPQTSRRHPTPWCGRFLSSQTPQTPWNPTQTFLFALSADISRRHPQVAMPSADIRRHWQTSADRCIPSNWISHLSITFPAAGSVALPVEATMQCDTMRPPGGDFLS